MDHKSLMQSLPPKLRADLTQTSDAAGLRHLALNLAAIAATSAVILTAPPLWWLALPVHGVLLVFLFTLEHEATHKTPFASPALNEVTGRLAGLVLILPFTWFRYFHLAHHKYTNLPGQDPELDHPGPQTRRAWAWHVSGLPYWAGQIRLVLALALGRSTDARYIPVAALPRIRAEARTMLVLYALACSSLLLSPAVLWLWALPVLLGQPFLRIYLLAEHGDCPQVANMLENSRTTLTLRLVRFLAWNMPYHAEHHCYPAVPFHKLPTLHDAVRTQLRMTAAGYGAHTRAYLARRPF